MNLSTSSPRPFSNEDAKVAYEHFARRAVDIFNTEGRVEPQMFFVVLDDCRPRNIAFVKALPPKAVERFERSSAGRARRFRCIADSFIAGSDIAEALKRQGLPVVPSFVAQVAEVILHTGGAGDIAGTDTDSVCHEAVLVVIFSHSRQYAGVCMIHNNPRRCVYGALQDGMSIGLRAASGQADVGVDEDDGEGEMGGSDGAMVVH
jgi:hypothetical protein